MSIQPSNSIRIPAEWEEQEAVLLALPHDGTDWAYCLSDVLACYKELVSTMLQMGENVILLCRSRKEAEDALGPEAGRCQLVEADYNDTWTRDYGPISAERHGRVRALDFGFNGWGLKFAADKDNLVNLSLADKSIWTPGTYRNERDFVLEGGSIESDGCGTILTTSRCLQSPNRNGGHSKDELNEILSRRLGADHVLWLDYGALEGDDTDSHIDTLARLCPDNTILFVGCRYESDAHFEQLLRMRAQLTLMRNQEGNPFNLVELPMPSPIYDEEGCRLPATYANYLVTPRCVYVPTYSQPDTDRLAMLTIGSVYADRAVKGVDCRALIRQHGSLHCATMQLYPGVVNATHKSLIQDIFQN